jgi:SH3-like domain-containing protein
VRRGPSLSHRIDWVFSRRNMPLEVTDEYGHWRRVRDRDGQGGWIHHSLLSGVRTVIVEEDMAALLIKPDPAAPVNARAEAGVIAELDECARLVPDRAGGYRGWVLKTALWGVAAPRKCATDPGSAAAALG